MTEKTKLNAAERLLSAPKQIDPLDDKTMEYLFKRVESAYLKGKTKIIGPYKGSTIFTFGDNENGYYGLIRPDNELLYAVKYTSVTPRRFGRQVLVARRRTHTDAARIAEHIFFELLLPRFGALTTDTQQTERGQDFWTYVVSDAFEKNLHVYRIDHFKSVGSKLTYLPTIEDFNSIVASTWGKTDWYLTKGIIISIKPITE